MTLGLYHTTHLGTLTLFWWWNMHNCTPRSMCIYYTAINELQTILCMQKITETLHWKTRNRYIDRITLADIGNCEMIFEYREGRYIYQPSDWFGLTKLYLYLYDNKAKWDVDGRNRLHLLDRYYNTFSNICTPVNCYNVRYKNSTTWIETSEYCNEHGSSLLKIRLTVMRNSYLSETLLDLWLAQ